MRDRWRLLCLHHMCQLYRSFLYLSLIHISYTPVLNILFCLVILVSFSKFYFYLLNFTSKILWRHCMPLVFSFVCFVIYLSLIHILFSISWTPCIGAFLSSALLLVATHQDMFKGIILMIVYSIGLGIPFVISAILIEKLKSVFDFIKKHYDIVKKASGLVLIFMGLYLIIF